MKTKTGMCKIIFVTICLWAGFAVAGYIIYAGEETPELNMQEIDKAYQELKDSYGEEEAKAFLEECRIEAHSGNIKITETEADNGKEALTEEYDKLKTTIESQSRGTSSQGQGQITETIKVEADKLGIPAEDAQKLEEAMKAGDWETADKLFKELGLPEKFEGPGDEEHYVMAPDKALEEFHKELDAGHLDMFDEKDVKAIEEAMGRGDMEAAARIGQEAGEAHYREMGVEDMAKEFQEKTGQEFTKEMEDRAREWQQEHEQIQQDREQMQERLQERMEYPQPQPEPPPQPQP